MPWWISLLIAVVQAIPSLIKLLSSSAHPTVSVNERRDVRAKAISAIKNHRYDSEPLRHRIRDLTARIDRSKPRV